MVLDILMVMGIMIAVCRASCAVVATSNKFKPAYRYDDPTINVYLAMKGKRN